MFGRSRRHLPGIPEFSVALFSFLLHSVWEFIQLPAYQGMPLASHWEGILLCFAATAGDVGLILLAFWTASIAAGSRSWILYPGLRPRAVFVMAGLGFTIVLEYYHTEIAAR